MSPSWNLRRYQPGDEIGITELLSATFGKWHDLKYWNWWYKRNPAGTPIIWVAEFDGKIIGHYGIIPLVMKVGSSYVTGSFASDGATHPDYRGMGVMSSILNRLFLDAAESKISFTCGFASSRLWFYRRYERIGRISRMILMARVLNWEATIASISRNSMLSHVPGKVLDKILTPTHHNRNLTIERVVLFDERIDYFWNKISQTFGIIVKRDRNYLNWRYVNHPQIPYVIYQAVRNGRVMGYCVLSEQERNNLKLGVIADMVGFGGHSEALECLMGRALHHFEEIGVDAAACLMSGGHPYLAMFARAGFIPYPRWHEILYASVNLPSVRSNNNEVYVQTLSLARDDAFLKRKQNWFMMTGDAHRIR